MKKKSDAPPPEQMQKQSDRAAELDRVAIQATVESSTSAREARERIDQKLAAFLDDDDLDDTTGMRNLAEMVKQSPPPIPPDVVAVATVMDRADEAPDTPTLPSLRAQRESPEPTTLRPVLDAEKPRVEYVLVVDDNEDLAEAIAERLRDEGYRVRVAHDGIEALKKALVEKPAPDCILLDIGLPFLPGPGVDAALKHTHLRDVPRFFITGYDQATIAKPLRDNMIFIPKSNKLADECVRAIKERIDEWRNMPRTYW